MKQFTSYIFALAALLCLPLFCFFLLLVIEHHPLLIAERDRLWFYVPYWEMEQPPEVFSNGWPTIGKLDVKGIELYYVSVSNGRQTWWNLWIDAWAPAAITGLLPAAWIWRKVRRRQKRLVGCCSVCGYDLRATPDRCPECGTIPLQHSMRD
jgi:hypothetical protein